MKLRSQKLIFVLMAIVSTSIQATRSRISLDVLHMHKEKQNTTFQDLLDVPEAQSVAAKFLHREFIEELLQVERSTKLQWIRALDNADYESKDVPAFFFAMKPFNLGSVWNYQVVVALQNPINVNMFHESSQCKSFKMVYDEFLEKEAPKADPQASNYWVLWKLVILDPWLFDRQCGVLREHLNLNSPATERRPMEIPVHLWDDSDHKVAAEIDAANDPLYDPLLARLRNNDGFLQKALAFKRVFHSALKSLSASVSFGFGAGTGFPLVAFGSILVTLAVEADISTLLTQVVKAMRSSENSDVMDMVDKLDSAIPALRASSMMASGSAFSRMVRHKVSASATLALHLGYHVFTQFGLEVDITFTGQFQFLVEGEDMMDKLPGESASHTEVRAACLSPSHAASQTFPVFPPGGKVWSFQGALSLGCLSAIWHLVKQEVRKAWQTTTSKIKTWFAGASKNAVPGGIESGDENNAAVSLGADEESVAECEADSTCDRTLVQTLQDSSDDKPSRWQRFKNWLAKGWTMHFSASVMPPSVKVYLTRSVFHKSVNHSSTAEQHGTSSLSMLQADQDEALEAIANEHLNTLFGELSVVDELKSMHRLSEDEHRFRTQEQLLNFAAKMDTLASQ